MMTGVELLERSAPTNVERYRREIAESRSMTGLENMATDWQDVQISAPVGLRDLKTWWCELNQIRRPGGGPYLLREVADMIASGVLPDSMMAAKIRIMIADWEGGRLPLPTVKLVRNGATYQIADANHRAAVILLSGQAVRVPAVLLYLAPGTRVAPC